MIYKGSATDVDNLLSNIVQNIVTNSSWELVSTYNTNDKVYPVASNHLFNNPITYASIGNTSYTSLTDDPYYKKEGSDGYVLRSIPLGKYNRRIYVRLKYLDKCFFYTGSNATSSSNSVWDYGHPIILVQLMENFTPGPNNTTRGTVSLRKTDYFTVSLNNIFKNGEVNFLVNVEDNYIAMCFERNDTIATARYNSIFYVGYPEANTVVENDSLIPITIIGTNINFPVGAGVNVAYILNEYSTKANPATITTVTDLSPYNPSASGIYTMSKINLIRSGTFIGDLDNIFALPTANIVNSDIIVKDGKKYQVFQTDLNGKRTYSYFSNPSNEFYASNSLSFIWKNTFPATYIAMRIE